MRYITRILYLVANKKSNGLRNLRPSRFCARTYDPHYHVHPSLIQRFGSMPHCIKSPPTLETLALLYPDRTLPSSPPQIHTRRLGAAATTTARGPIDAVT